MRKRSRFKKIREFVNQFQTCVYLRKKKEDVFRILFLSRFVSAHVFRSCADSHDVKITLYSQSLTEPFGRKFRSVAPALIATFVPVMMISFAITLP